MLVEAWRGSIVHITGVDAIVNAANEGLRAGSGVCGAIFSAAGHADMQAACDRLGRCATGDAKATPGFALAVSWVIHAVGPVWRGGDHGEDALLAAAYRRSLEVAAAVGARSVAFPGISTGVYGFPKEPAATIAMRTVREHPGPVERVVLVGFTSDEHERNVRLLRSA